MSNPTQRDAPRQSDHERIRRFLRAAEIVKDAGRVDEYWAEVRSIEAQGNHYWATPSQRWLASDLAAMVPKEFGDREQIEAIAIEHVVGSSAATRLKAIETVAREVLEGASRRPAESKIEAEQDPPPPPADWQPSAPAAAPIKIKAAGDVPACVKAAQAAKGRRL